MTNAMVVMSLALSTLLALRNERHPKSRFAKVEGGLSLVAGTLIVSASFLFCLSVHAQESRAILEAR
jgi:hypothetical protein